jgi:hypothetical protein
VDLTELVRRARSRLPAEHRALLEQVGVQETVTERWPSGVQALYRTLGEMAPAADAVSDAVALWLPTHRVVAFNGPLLGHTLSGLTPSASQELVDFTAWHEYGHALSVVRATPAMRSTGPRLVERLPPGLRGAIDFPGGYRRDEVFDEMIANVYALMVGRVVHGSGYGFPDFLEREVVAAFRAVIPWPPGAS